MEYKSQYGTLVFINNVFSNVLELRMYSPEGHRLTTLKLCGYDMETIAYIALDVLLDKYCKNFTPSNAYTAENGDTVTLSIETHRHGGESVEMTVRIQHTSKDSGIVEHFIFKNAHIHVDNFWTLLKICSPIHSIRIDAVDDPEEDEEDDSPSAELRLAFQSEVPVYTVDTSHIVKTLLSNSTL